MNDMEDIHADSYEESYFDSHQGNIVCDNMIKVALLTPYSSKFWSLSTHFIALEAITNVRESI